MGIFFLSDQSCWLPGDSWPPRSWRSEVGGSERPLQRPLRTGDPRDDQSRAQVSRGKLSHYCPTFILVRCRGNTTPSFNVIALNDNNRTCKNDQSLEV